MAARVRIHGPRLLGIPVELWSRGIVRAALYVIVAILSVLFMLPFVWAGLSSLKTIPELYIYPPAWFPQVPQWNNYAQIFREAPMARWLVNSVYVAGATVLASVVSSALTGYGFARFRFKGRQALFLMVLSAVMLPSAVTTIPTFIIFSKLKWLDTYRPLIIPAWFGGGAFNIFLMRQFFQTIPLDLDEAAKIDGAGPWRVFWTILFPLAGPALATAAILQFIGAWNDFMGPLIYLSSEEKYTVSVGIRWFQTFQGAAQARPREHLLMGASMIVATPPLILFFLAQKYFVRGIVMSGIKG